MVLQVFLGWVLLSLRRGWLVLPLFLGWRVLRVRCRWLVRLRCCWLVRLHCCWLLLLLLLVWGELLWFLPRLFLVRAPPVWRSRSLGIGGDVRVGCSTSIGSRGI